MYAHIHTYLYIYIYTHYRCVFFTNREITSGIPSRFSQCAQLIQTWAALRFSWETYGEMTGHPLNMEVLNANVMGKSWENGS